MITFILFIINNIIFVNCFLSSIHRPSTSWKLNDVNEEVLATIFARLSEKRILLDVEGAGTPEMITKNLEEYEELAVKLAKNYLSPGAGAVSQLDKIRERLEKNRFSNALFDTKKWVKGFEVGISKVWKCYEKGRAPENVESVTVVDL